MAQTLFLIPATIAGLPVFGFGLLLAVWMVVSVAILAWFAYRQGWNADTWGYVPILVLIGVIIRWLLPELCENGGLPIRGYGVMMFLAVVSATMLAAWRARDIGIDPDTIFSLGFWMLLPGIVGARAFYVIEYWPNYWQAYLNSNGSAMALVGAILHVNQGGLVVYGSFFGGFFGMLIFARKHKFPLLALCDLAAPSMALGVAIGRIGCLLNGCCYGGLCDHAWAITFPPNSPPYRSQVERGLLYGFSLDADPEAEPIIRKVNPGSAADRAGLKLGDVIQGIVVQDIDEPHDTNKPKEDVRNTGDAYLALERTLYHEESLKLRLTDGKTIEIPAVPIPARSLPVQPAQIFSTIDGLLLCLLLLAFSSFRRRDGEVFALLMSIYPITRFLIEGLRSDEASVFGTGMSISQNVSLILLTCAVALWCYILYQPPGTFSVASASSKQNSLHKQK